MLRTPLLVALALAIAFSGGIASTLAALKANTAFGRLTVGPWVANPLAQTAAADPYTKAQRALSEDLALGQAEGLIFTATTDSAGAPLLKDCAYRVTGQTPASRLWILSLSGTGISGDRAAYFPRSIHSSRIVYESDGAFTVALDDMARSGNWLKLEPGGTFALTLTLFDTPAAGNSGLVDLAMPDIEKGACGDA